MQQEQISDGRKATYYIGMAMMILGVVLFFSCFFSVVYAMRHPFGAPPQSVIHVYPANETELVDQNRDVLGLPRKSKSINTDSQIFLRAIAGIIFVALGGILMGVGQRGLAGSGVVLDPNQARDDLKPWSQMAGGMLDDALSQSETVSKITHQKEEVIKIKCQKCGALNDEDAKYCDECGTKI